MFNNPVINRLFQCNSADALHQNSFNLRTSRCTPFKQTELDLHQENQVLFYHFHFVEQFMFSEHQNVYV